MSKIDYERYAPKALRGDFAEISGSRKGRGGKRLAARDVEAAEK